MRKSLTIYIGVSVFADDPASIRTQARCRLLRTENRRISQSLSTPCLPAFQRNCNPAKISVTGLSFLMQSQRFDVHWSLKHFAWSTLRASIQEPLARRSLRLISASPNIYEHRGEYVFLHPVSHCVIVISCLPCSCELFPQLNYLKSDPGSRSLV